MVCRLIWKKLVSILSLGRLQVKKPLVYNDMMLSYMTPEEFYRNTRSYLRRLWIFPTVSS